MKSQRTFADMREALKQYDNGLINMAELLMCLQMSDIQLEAVRRSLALPCKVQAKIQLSDFDDWVRAVEDKTEALKEEQGGHVADSHTAQRAANSAPSV